MTVRSKPQGDASTEEAPAAVAGILGANLFVGLNRYQFIDILQSFIRDLLSRPDRLASGFSELSRELLKIAAGTSAVQPAPDDRRFSDVTWSENPFYRRLMQAYLTWRTAVHHIADSDDEANGSDWKLGAQRNFAVTLLTEALAPTNLLFGNPAALKRAFETGGLSLISGLSNFLDDLRNNGGMPSQVDKRHFHVGENLAVTPGAVVHRSDLCEIIQYQPATETVYHRPVLLVPPQINKFYIMDLAPSRSLTEYAVAHGVQFFTVSWRNPTAEHRDWSLNDYVSACKQATLVVSDIARSDDVNLLGVCAGGIIAALLLGHLAASGDRRVNAATLLVTMLDSSERSMTGMFATKEMVEAAIRRSRKEGILDAASIARLFAWLRPNDLVWNYWVNNYLMGAQPAPFDILFWNSDSTNLPAELHAGFLDLLLRNSLVHPGAAEILGTPLDLGAISCDIYILAGQTDHICSFRTCYRAAKLFGGQTEFVLNSSGHVQSLVCPPDNPKAKYRTNVKLPKQIDKWLDTASEHKGSWWDHWLRWLEPRSGEKRAAPASLGNKKFPPLEKAPGTYVHDKP